MSVFRQIFCLKNLISFMGLLGDIQAEIEARSLPNGGWAARTGNRASVETTCYGLMALHDRRGTARDNAIDFLLRIRNRDGSWPAFDGDDAGGCWTTALAFIALRFVYPSFPDLNRSLSWLLRNKGREGHWFWKWKFKTVDRAVQFDPEKFGWPWFSGTVSWIIPTAVALIALKQSLVCCRAAEVTNRVELGTAMLLDRACPSGGWNAGNGVVFGAPLKAHIDSTAVALLALADSDDAIAVQSLNWLRHASLDCSSVYSLSWAELALLAHRDIALNRCAANLVRALSAKSLSNIEALMLAAIAMNAIQENGNPFGW
jgi:hypothetical protein